MIKKETMEMKMKDAWDVTFRKFYYPKTGMFYDALYGNSIEESLDAYPTPEEIKASSPNPCGWNTGMEDATLSACPMVEAIIARYEVAKESEMKKYSDLVYREIIINVKFHT